MSDIANRLRNRVAGFDRDDSLEKPLLLVAADRIVELEMAIIDFKASLRTCSSTSSSVMDQHKDL